MPHLLPSHLRVETCFLAGVCLSSISFLTHGCGGSLPLLLWNVHSGLVHQLHQLLLVHADAVGVFVPLQSWLLRHRRGHMRRYRLTLSQEDGCSCTRFTMRVAGAAITCSALSLTSGTYSYTVGQSYASVATPSCNAGYYKSSGGASFTCGGGRHAHVCRLRRCKRASCG